MNQGNSRTKRRERAAIRMVARQNGTNPKEVEASIESIWTELIAHPDPVIREYWKAIPCKLKTPTAQEMVEHGVGAYALYFFQFKKNSENWGSSMLELGDVVDMVLGTCPNLDETLRTALQSYLDIRSAAV